MIHHRPQKGVYRIQERVTSDGLYIEWSESFASADGAEAFLRKRSNHGRALANFRVVWRYSNGCEVCKTFEAASA